MISYVLLSMRGSKKFCQKGSKFDNVFLNLVDEGVHVLYHYNRSSSARRRNAIYMAFGWRANDGPTLNAGLVAL